MGAIQVQCNWLVYTALVVNQHSSNLNVRGGSAFVRACDEKSRFALEFLDPLVIAFVLSGGRASHQTVLTCQG